MEEISKINKRYTSFLIYLFLIWFVWLITTGLLDHLLLRPWLKSMDKETRFIINAIRTLAIVMSIQSVIFIYDFIFWLRNRKNYRLAVNFYVLWLLMFLSALFGGLFWGLGRAALAAPYYYVPLGLNHNVWVSLGIIDVVSFIAGLVFIIRIIAQKIPVISGPRIGQ